MDGDGNDHHTDNNDGKNRINGDIRMNESPPILPNNKVKIQVTLNLIISFDNFFQLSN